jgi:hypothetical protein
MVGSAIAHHFLDHDDATREAFPSHVYGSDDSLQGPDDDAHYENSSEDNIDSDDYAESNLDEGFDGGGFDDGGDIV